MNNAIETTTSVYANNSVAHSIAVARDFIVTPKNAVYFSMYNLNCTIAKISFYVRNQSPNKHGRRLTVLVEHT